MSTDDLPSRRRAGSFALAIRAIGVIRGALFPTRMSSHVPTSMSVPGLEAFLHEQIPLTRAMGLRVAECNAQRLVLEATLEPNRNHLGTAFGGSLHALPTLACYGTLWMVLREAGIDSHVVIKDSQISYRQPVKGTLRAVCERPPAAALAEFIAVLRRNLKAGMDLHAIVVGTDGKPAAEFSGRFVALV